MIKTKIIEGNAISWVDRLDDKINKFIKENNIKVVDIKFAGIGRDNSAVALIMYEVKENDKKD